jgi:hypothetical protein
VQYKTQLESLRSKVVEDMDTVKRRDNLDFVQVGLIKGCSRSPRLGAKGCLSFTSDLRWCTVQMQLVGLAVPGGSLCSQHLMQNAPDAECAPVQVDPAELKAKPVL